MGFFYLSLLLSLYLDLYRTNTIEIILLNGFVYATIIAQEIISIISKVKNLFFKIKMF